MKLKQADMWFSRCVRKSKGWKCERCGAQHDQSSKGLHCSHIFGRRHRTIRWCKENVQSLCASCHNWYGENPADSGHWIEEYLGSDMLAILREKRDSGVKISKLEESDISKHYKKEFDRIEEGEDFTSWQ